MAFGDRRKALIVGINDYQQAPLRGCIYDAKSMGEVLRRHAKFDPNFDCQLHLGEKGNPIPITTAFLQGRIEALFSEEVETVLFYFSGHGLAVDGKLYLVTQDCSKVTPGVALDWVLDKAQKSEATNIVLILDCCHAGQAGNNPVFEIPTAQLRKGVSILSATSPEGYAVERMGQGKFTSLLVRGLQGAAIDIVGHVTVPSLYAYSDSFMGLWEQRPMLKAHLNGLPALRYCKPKIRKDYLRQIIDLFPNPDQEMTMANAEPAKEAENARVLRMLRIFRRFGLVQTHSGKTISRELKLGAKCMLTEEGKDIHLLVTKGKI